jgi:hypothetical protein
MKKIVGISGQLGSGKDSAADRLVTKFGLVKVALADPIKRYGYNVFHFTEEQLWGPSNFRNALDDRFQLCESPTEGDDAWMAVFRRAEKYNRAFVKELFPNDAVKQGAAFTALEKWLEGLTQDYPRISPRIMLQTLGTEWGRVLQPKVWIKHAIRISEKLLEGGCVYDRAVGLVTSDASEGPSGVVISDVRFQNELEDIKRASGFLIRIRRPHTDEEAAATGIEGHLSEQEQQSFEDSVFNYVIVNNGTISDLIADVDIAGFILTGSQQ